MKHAAIIVTILSCAALGAVGALAQTQAVSFHWAPSPSLDDLGNPLPEAVGYQVWLRRDADLPEQIATVLGDTVYTLQAEAGVVQRLSVRGFDDDGRVSLFSEWSDPVYFEEEIRGDDDVPPNGALQRNFPNPFNPETHIRYGIPADLDASTPVRLEIFAIDGRRVRSFAADRSEGWHEVVWDGTDDRGVLQSTGMYVTRFVVGTRVETTKMTMLK